MAPVRRPSQAVVFLLIALACASDFCTNTAQAATDLGARNRKLLQSGGAPSSDLSNPFGTPRPGTLVVTWSAIPAAYRNPFRTPFPAPYQYNWSVRKGGVIDNETSVLLFYAVDAYVAGLDGKVQLTSHGNCDVVTTRCGGAFDVPADLPAVSGVYMLLQAPNGLKFEAPTPIDGFNCTAGLAIEAVMPTRIQRQLDSVFDSGAIIPVDGNVVLPNRDRFTKLSLYSQPFTAMGMLTFQSINMQLQYDPPVQLSEGRDSLMWGLDLDSASCTFKNTRLAAVQSGNPSPTSPPPTASPTPSPTTTSPTSSPTPAPTTEAPTNSPTPSPTTKAPTASPTPGPTPTTPPPTNSPAPATPFSSVLSPKTLVPPSTQCVAYNGAYTNSCFNTGGTKHVCCMNPGSCGPFDADGNPTCTNSQYYVFN